MENQENLPQADQYLDTCGQLCPLPTIKTQNQLQQMKPGETLLVTATDPGTRHDIPAICRIHGHHLEQQGELDKVFHFLIRACR